MRGETKGDDDRVTRQHFFRACHHFGAATATLIGRAHLGFHQLDACDFACGIGFNGHGLGIEFELHAFFFGILKLFARAWHVVGIAAVSADDFGGFLADGCAHTVHGSVTTTQHHHAFALHGHKVAVVVAHQVFGIAD